MVPEPEEQTAERDAEGKPRGEQAAFRACAQSANYDGRLEYEQRCGKT
jgi:hypothetical protein